MINVNNLDLIIDGNVILDNISFSIAKGEYIGLIGPNGAGKSSLIKTILGFYKPTSGSIKNENNISIGYVPQKYQLSDVVPISVKEVLWMSGLKNKDNFIESLNKVGLKKDFMAKNFHKLSGGQQQRVIIARALCINPEILIFDEPLNGVDYESKLSIYELLADLNKNQDLAILFVSHEVDHIISQCHSVLCLNKKMHTGCHPLDFAKGKMTDCPILEGVHRTLPIHHHHNQKSKCSC